MAKCRLHKVSPKKLFLLGFKPTYRDIKVAHAADMSINLLLFCDFLLKRHVCFLFQILS